jgi:hypothetical protein
MSPIASCKKRLGLLWFGTSGFLMVVMVIQTLGVDVFEGHPDQAWGWFLQTVMPTLGLIAAVFVADATTSQVQDASKEVDAFFFWLTLGVSTLYLLLVAVVLLYPSGNPTRLELMKQSSLYLGPCQGLASTLLGIFFFKAQTKAGQTSHSVSSPAGAD